jgi:hypothetical protein
LGQFVHKKVFPTEDLSCGFPCGESKERGCVLVAVADWYETSLEKEGIVVPTPGRWRRKRR